MPSYARKEIVPDGEVGVYHCVNRCVRRAWLCGDDPVSGRSYQHRKDWIRDRLEELAGSFAVDVCLGLQSESWIDCVDNFGRWFHRAAGHVSLLSDAAARAGRQWFHGVSRCRQAFA